MHLTRDTPWTSRVREIALALPAGSIPLLLLTTAFSAGVAHFLTLQDQGPDVFTNSRNFGTDQPVTYYLNSGSTLGFHADTTDFAGFTVCTFQINGYLISYP